jgi:solute carrier family 25 protein 34/35
MPERSLAIEFATGGGATMAAALFTNPIEVVKTRMQLQGELERRDSITSLLSTSKPSGASAESTSRYRNPVSAFFTIARTEGLRGIQSGLGPAFLYQLMMNGTRLGLYGPLQRWISPDPNTRTYRTNVLAGCMSVKNIPRLV